ncbi:hypothetical protein I3843_15G102000 [Carya illinoinensis]|nr:hypothetical protein I3843_15G102000 [Carya illinoinensis]
MLPRLSSEGPITIFGLSLAFEPTESPYYHVVCVRSSDVSDYFYQLEVYSSETRAWRPRISPFVAQSDMVFDNGVFWNGGIHWLSPSGAGLCFDIEEEILGVMPSAPVSEGCADRRPGYFGTSGGHLHLVEANGSWTTRFKIFEMERDYTRWLVKYEVDLGQLVVDFPETVLIRDFIIKSEYTNYAYIGVCVVRRKDSSLLLLHIPGKIISYNLEDEF